MIYDVNYRKRENRSLIIKDNFFSWIDNQNEKDFGIETSIGTNNYNEYATGIHCTEALKCVLCVKYLKNNFQYSEILILYLIS